MDALSINMEVTDSLFSGNIKDLLHIQKDLQERIRSTFFISADVKLVEEGSIPRSIGKAQRVIDKRGEQQ
jgi:phenylacetate-CoA ligase